MRTLSNAMDVGNPSNFARLKAFYQNDRTTDDNTLWEAIKEEITGKFCTDAQTREAIHKVYQRYQYTMCPHTAVGYLGLQDYLAEQDRSVYGVILATAHPAKFLDVVEDAIEQSYPLPDSLNALLHQEKQAVSLAGQYEALKEYLLNHR